MAITFAILTHFIIYFSLLTRICQSSLPAAPTLPRVNRSESHVNHRTHDSYSYPCLLSTRGFDLELPGLWNSKTTPLFLFKTSHVVYSSIHYLNTILNFFGEPVVGELVIFLTFCVRHTCRRRRLNQDDVRSHLLSQCQMSEVGV